MPELRNRIYDYAQDSYFPCCCSPYVPRAHKRSQSGLATLWVQRMWQFLGLAQTCQQLRSEYRPLWIRDLAVRLRPNNFSEFVATFLPSSQELQHGPQLIQISWWHGYDNITRERIMPMLLLHAQLPKFASTLSRIAWLI
jgi:hypothetical protein